MGSSRVLDMGVYVPRLGLMQVFSTNQMLDHAITCSDHFIAKLRPMPSTVFWGCPKYKCLAHAFLDIGSTDPCAKVSWINWSFIWESNGMWCWGDCRAQRYGWAFGGFNMPGHCKGLLVVHGATQRLPPGATCVVPETLKAQGGSGEPGDMLFGLVWC